MQLKQYCKEKMGSGGVKLASGVPEWYVRLVWRG
jgi:hypothetical protein